MGTRLPGGSAFGLGGSCGDYRCAHCTCHCDGGRAHASGGAEHKHRLTRSQISAILQTVDRGKVVYEQAGCVSIRQICRGPVTACLIDADVVGKCAVGGAEHAHIHTEVSTCPANCLNHTGVLARRVKWQWRFDLVKALDQQTVDETDTGCRDPYKHLVWVGFRRRHFNFLQC